MHSLGRIFSSLPRVLIIALFAPKTLTEVFGLRSANALLTAMRRKLILGLVVGATLATADTASASSLVVTYDLAPSSHFDLTTPVAIANTPVTGSLTSTFNADNSGNIIDGPITLDSYVANIKFGAGPLSALGIAGSATSTLSEPASSTLTGTTIAPASVTTALSGTVTCDTVTCGTAVSLPPSTSFGFSSQVSINATVGTGNPSTVAAVGAIGPLTLGTVSTSGTVFFNGTETRRTFVPEPSTLLLVASGVVGLAVRRRHARGASLTATISMG
jgi:hypothetical protein